MSFAIFRKVILFEYGFRRGELFRLFPLFLKKRTLFLRAGEFEAERVVFFLFLRAAFLLVQTLLRLRKCLGRTLQILL